MTKINIAKLCTQVGDKMEKIETTLEEMIAYQLNAEDLIECKKVLAEIEKRPRSFYKSKLSYRFEMVQKEHFKNIINYWEEILKNESK